jgi:hypothetical protein
VYGEPMESWISVFNINVLWQKDKAVKRYCLA